MNSRVLTRLLEGKRPHQLFRELEKRCIEDGGFSVRIVEQTTLDLNYRHSPKYEVSHVVREDGRFIVSIESIHGSGKLTKIITRPRADWLRAYVKRSRFVLSGLFIFGCWLNKKTGLYELDHNIAVSSLEQAKGIARASNQEEIYDLQTGKSIPVEDLVEEMA